MSQIGCTREKDAARGVQDRRTRKTKAAIRLAFEGLLSEKDYSKITVTEIAQRADIDRKTFYLHYGSIDALVDELLHEEMEREAKVLERAARDENGKIDVIQLLGLLGSDFLVNFKERAAFAKHVDADKLIMRLQPMMVQTITENDSLKLAESLGPYLNMFVAYFCSGLLALYRSWISEGSSLPLEKVAVLAGSAVTGGVVALTSTAESISSRSR